LKWQTQVKNTNNRSDKFNEWKSNKTFDMKKILLSLFIFIIFSLYFLGNSSCKRNDDIIPPIKDSIPNMDTNPATDFRDVYLGTYICELKRSLLFMTDTGNYYVTHLISDSALVEITKFSDSMIDVGGMFQAAMIDTAHFQSWYPDDVFFFKGDSMIIEDRFAGTGYNKYRGKKIP
jgi:hypothetical protein